MHILYANRKTEMAKKRIVTWDADGDITDLVDELNDAWLRYSTGGNACN